MRNQTAINQNTRYLNARNQGAITKNLAATGIGFRMEHAEQVLQQTPQVPWFEILIDNYMAENAPLSIIDKLVDDYPITFHGVGLSIGTIEPVDYQ